MDAVLRFHDKRCCKRRSLKILSNVTHENIVKLINKNKNKYYKIEIWNESENEGDRWKQYSVEEYLNLVNSDSTKRTNNSKGNDNP